MQRRQSNQYLWLTAAATFLIGASTVPVSAGIDAREVFRKISPSVVLVKTYDVESTPIKLGSGFFVEDGHKIVTNFHVIDGAASVEIVLPDKSSVETRDLVAYSREHDLAILQVPAVGEPVPLSTRKPDVGDHILALGNPIGLQRTLSEGLISGIREIGDGTVYQMTAPISPGSSGGPIIDDDGKAIGVTSFTVLESQNINFAIPSADVLDLLRAPAPISLSNLPRAKHTGGVVFGKGGLEVVKFAKTGNVVGISIKNTTDSTISGVLIRILYSEQPSEDDKIKKMEQGIVALKSAVFQKEQARAFAEGTLKRLSSMEFENLSSEDAAFLRELWPNLESDAEIYRQTKRNQAIWTDPIARQSAQNLIDDDWRHLQTDLAAVRDSMHKALLQTNDVEDDRKTLSGWETTLKEMRSTTQTSAGTLVHYEDKSLGGIAPRMTRYYEFAGEGKAEWRAKALVIDHVIAGQEKDKLITAGQANQ